VTTSARAFPRPLVRLSPEAKPGLRPAPASTKTETCPAVMIAADRREPRAERHAAESVVQMRRGPQAATVGLDGRRRGRRFVVVSLTGDERRSWQMSP